MKFQILQIPEFQNFKFWNLEFGNSKFQIPNSWNPEFQIPGVLREFQIPESGIPGILNFREFLESRFSEIPIFGIPPHSNWHCTTQPSTGTTQSQQSHMTHVTKRHKRCHNQPRHNTCTQNVKPLLAVPPIDRTGIAFPALFFAASSLPLSSRNIPPLCPAPSSCHKLQQLCCKTIIRQCDIVPL